MPFQSFHRRHKACVVLTKFCLCTAGANGIGSLTFPKPKSIGLVSAEMQGAELHSEISDLVLADRPIIRDLELSGVASSMSAGK
jgi:hypothetical protein